jgi:hypothetical protein
MACATLRRKACKVSFWISCLSRSARLALAQAADNSSARASFPFGLSQVGLSVQSLHQGMVFSGRIQVFFARATTAGPFPFPEPWLNRKKTGDP